MPKCKVCRQPFDKFRMEQKTCLDPDCLVSWGRTEAIKRQAKKEKQERAEIKARKMALKPLNWYAKKAEKAVNAYVLVYESDQPCISCGTFDAQAFHAGHFISVGASSALRFNLDNIHKQCNKCNIHLSGNLTAYEERLTAKIGADKVEALKTAPRAYKWSREEYLEVEQDYKRKIKSLGVS